MPAGTGGGGGGGRAWATPCGAIEITPEGIAFTASLFDELLARRTVPGRPTERTKHP
jgi:hypothetical protein